MGRPIGGMRAALAWLALAAGAAAAADDAAVDGTAPLELDPVEVVAVASRLDRPRDEVVGVVDVIDREAIEARAARDAADLVRYLPGVSLEGTGGTRFGDTGFSVRGVGGDRVAVELDGVPVNDHFAVGAFANATRDLLDPELIRRVEVLRGPASTLYGSDALGGVVAISSSRPEDLLSGAGGFAGALRLGHASVDDGGALAGVAAFGAADHGLLLGASAARGHQAEHAAAASVPEDPQDWHRRALLASYGVELDDGSRLRLIAQGADESVVTDVRSLLGRGRFNTTTELGGDDEQDRDSLVAQWEFGPRLGLARGQLRAWASEIGFAQATVQLRGLANPVTREERLFSYQQSAWGFGADLEARFAPLDQRLGFGVEFARTATEERRDGTRYDLTNDTVSNTILGEEFPVRDFPNSTVDELGLYAQDELALGGGLTLIPGLRFDRYTLDPHPDATYAADNPATTPAAIADQALSPKLALAWAVGASSDLFLQYAHGFRAPPFEDVNIGLDIPLFGYRAIPNPDLVPEESDGVELGWRWAAGRSRVELALFRTDYQDLIESRVNLGVDPGSGLTIFQSQNLDAARIEGVEASAQHERRGPGGSTLRLRAALASVDGEDRATGAPLNSIDPGELIAGVALEAPSGAWSVELIGTGVEAKDEVTDPTGTTLFRTPGYSVFDLYLNLRPSRRVTLTLALYNLADRTYWRWASVNGLAANDPVVDLLSAPGRSGAVTLRFEF